MRVRCVFGVFGVFGVFTSVETVEGIDWYRRWSRSQRDKAWTKSK